jgi:RNA polymerase sigma-70 factor (ECF subfamily)
MTSRFPHDADDTAPDGLVARAVRGDEAALEALVSTYRPRARRTALGLLGDPDGAEDVAQEAMLRMRDALAGFRGDADLGTWVHRIALNLSYDQLRRRRRRHAAEPLEAAAEHADPRTADPHTDVDRERARGALQAALNRLPDDQREVLTLRFLSGLSYAEIGRVTGAPPGTVASRIYRALERLGDDIDAKHLEIVR